MLSVEVRQYQITQIIKQTKYAGITKSELIALKGDHFDTDVESLLQKNEVLTYDPKTERYTYNFDPRFRNKDNLEKALQEQSCINISESLREDYGNIMDDAEVRFFVRVFPYPWSNPVEGTW